MPTPRVDLSLFNTRIYDIETVEVLIGESFKLKVQTEPTLEWFTNNDQVLDLLVVGNTADVQAKALGACTILLMNSSRQVVRALNIGVVEAILPEADKLSIEADPPVLK